MGDTEYKSCRACRPLFSSRITQLPKERYEVGHWTSGAYLPRSDDGLVQLDRELFGRLVVRPSLITRCLYAGQCTPPYAHEGDGCGPANACSLNNKNWVLSPLHGP